MPDRDGPRLIYITTDGPDEARAIGRALVEARLAACVNIVDPMASLYWWEGEVREGRETVLIAKTTAGLVDELTEKVRALHSYSCPCVVALPIEGGNPAFLYWIGAETGPEET
jgi:periplasmic divalent cation tolerance protein